MARGRRRRFRRIAALAGLAHGSLAPAPGRAHDGLDSQVARLTAELLRSPDDPELTLQRGDLLVLNGQPRAALEDYARAVELRPGLDVAARRGRALLAAGDAEAAARELDPHLVKNPDDVQARLTRAAARAATGRPGDAAADYDQAIAAIEAAVEAAAKSGPGPNTPAPVPPQTYLDRARARVQAGDVDEAVRGLDAAMARIGPVAALQLEAIELETRAGAFDRALARVDQVSAGAARKEEWLWRKGTLLLRAGRPAEARAAWRQALAAAESVPEARRRGKAHRELIEKIRAALDAPDATATESAAGKPGPEEPKRESPKP